ncbi:DUF523 domain-containing protein [Halobacteriovorax sp. HLS]|uniref:DUF523 domain-containing protein n=1 Tax=Halobacteriovorax sp. HLS TaxID=2234000 RepID=UPI000FDABA04|nr:DUF523 domain-containing protein [Halobacteriovorax sp. HLS]
MSEKIIVSACLAGLNCRYDCASKEKEDIVKLVKDGIAIPVCPEQLGGLSTPREPAEIQQNRVITATGTDVTEKYENGALEALKMVNMTGASKAILKSKSPMCGYGEIYDGSYTGKLKKGDGVFTKLLIKLGIKVESRD